MSLETEATSVSASLLLLEEQIAVVRQRIERDTIRVSTVTNTTEKHVAEEILHERVEVEHIAIGRPIDTVPPVREEGRSRLSRSWKRSSSSKSGSFLKKRCTYAAFES